MANVGNQKIKDTYQLVLQTDATGNLQKLDGSTPNPFIVNGNLRYVDGTQNNGYVLLSDAAGNASWGPVSFSGDVYISGGSIQGTTIELNASSGGTVSIPGLKWSANTDGSVSPSGDTTDVIIRGDLNVSGKTNIEDNLGVTGNTYVTGNVISANEDAYMFSCRGQDGRLSGDTTHWYGPDYQGIWNYSWSKDYGDDTEVLTLEQDYAHAGLLVPYNCVLTGFFTIGHSNCGTSGYSCGLWYVLQDDMASSLNVTGGTAGDVTLNVGVSGTTVNPGSGKNPLTIDKRGTVNIELTVGSMIYPRVGDSADMTDTTWNVYLKRT